MIFETKRLIIRIANNSDRDVEHYYKLWNHPKVMEMVGFPKGLGVTKDELRSKYLITPVSEFGCRLAVEYRETGELVGESKLTRPNVEGISDFDMKFLPEYWGKGLGKEILIGIIDYLFTHTDCKEIECTPNVQNVGAQKVYESLGFKIIKLDKYQWEHKEAMFYIRRLKRSDY